MSIRSEGSATFVMPGTRLRATVKASDLDWTILEIQEKPMGCETTYEAIVDVVTGRRMIEVRWRACEYPSGVLNYMECSCSPLVQEKGIEVVFEELHESED